METKDYPLTPTIIGTVPCFQRGDTDSPTGYANVIVMKDSKGEPISWHEPITKK